VNAITTPVPVYGEWVTTIKLDRLGNEVARNWRRVNEGPNVPNRIQYMANKNGKTIRYRSIARANAARDKANGVQS